MKLISYPCKLIDYTLLGSRVVGSRRSLVILSGATDVCGEVCEIIDNSLDI